MRNKRMKIKRKLNNAGMTLVEILVAMALLIVAIIPLSQGFMASMKHSANAKSMQQTSILAYTMMENCKAYSLDKIKELVTSNKFMPNATRTVTETDGDKYTTYFVKVPVFKKGTEVSPQYYDLEMIIEPYDASTNKTMMLYQNMNKYSDAVFIEDKSVDVLNSKTVEQCELEAYEYAIGRIINKITTSVPAGYTYVTPTVSDIKSQLDSGVNSDIMNVNRLINVFITNNAGVEECKVVYAYSFTFNSVFKFNATRPDGTTETLNINCNGAASSKSYEFKIFENSVSLTPLQDIYLIYNPTYNDRGINYGVDEINFTSTIGRDMNVYLIKQKAEGLAESELIDGERHYNPVLGGTSTNKIKLHHNLNVDLSGRNGTLGWNQVVFPSFYEIIDTDLGSGVEYLTNENPKKLMYKVKVAIYPNGSYKDDRGDGTKGMTQNALSSMDGTFLNW